VKSGCKIKWWFYLFTKQEIDMIDSGMDLLTSPGWLVEEIKKAVHRWRDEHPGSDYWRDPLCEVVSAADPTLEQLREAVDPEHAMPSDLLPDAKSVVVFFLPFRTELGLENARCKPYSSRSWALAYVETNALIQFINEHLKSCFRQAGYDAATTPATHNFDEEKLVSRWSHKHLAYLAGLGTFGKNHLLITRSGCCGRLGSLVTSMPLPVTPRTAGEWCLTKRGLDCSSCVANCRFGALREEGFDRRACYAQCLRNDAYYSDLPLVDVCGKCACEVPCSYQVPAGNLDC
jgi:epoxyqueuosine reductase QueG